MSALETKLFVDYNKEIFIKLVPKSHKFNSYKMSVKELPLESIFTAKQKPLYELYHNYFFSSMADPFDVSSEDRKAIPENDNCEGTYGEVVFEQFACLLNQIGVSPGQVFWDLGCGAGKPLAVAALMHPELKACKGVEYYPGLA